MALLGPTAVADDETAVGTRLTVIGWGIDLEQLLVAISRSNGLKVFCGFLSMDSDGRVAVRTIERLASWAERYDNGLGTSYCISRFITSWSSGYIKLS